MSLATSTMTDANAIGIGQNALEALLSRAIVIPEFEETSTTRRISPPAKKKVQKKTSKNKKKKQTVKAGRTSSNGGSNNNNISGVRRKKVLKKTKQTTNTNTPIALLLPSLPSDYSQAALDNTAVSIASSTMTGNLSTFQNGRNALQSLLSRVAAAGDDEEEYKTVDSTPTAEDNSGSRINQPKIYPTRLRRKVSPPNKTNNTRQRVTVKKENKATTFTKNTSISNTNNNESTTTRSCTESVVDSIQDVVGTGQNALEVLLSSATARSTTGSHSVIVPAVVVGKKRQRSQATLRRQK